LRIPFCASYHGCHNTFAILVEAGLSLCPDVTFRHRPSIAFRKSNIRRRGAIWRLPRMGKAVRDLLAIGVR
jgi:hypothetical protein